MITSLAFWVVLAASVATHWVLPPKWRWWFLAVVSAGYLATLDPRAAAAVVLLCGLFYYGCRVLDGPPKWATTTLVGVALVYLAFHKYFPSLYGVIFARDPDALGIAVPLGASYFTFKLVHYAVETSRGNVRAHGPAPFFAYLLFFPIFTAGPIERFEPFSNNARATWSKSEFFEGLTRIIYGLVKKLVIADILLARRQDIHHLVAPIPIVNPPVAIEFLLARIDRLSPLYAWQFVLNQLAYMYADFSAYTDIAIGASLLFGIRICENFDWPLLAPNVGEYWKRWHMSLSSWCQQYVYLPTIGATRNPYLATYATMIVMGVWHAGNLNYVAWGVYHATLLVVFLTYGRIKRKRKWKYKSAPLTALTTVLTILAVSAGQCFPATMSLGFYASVRLFARLLGLHVTFEKP